MTWKVKPLPAIPITHENQSCGSSNVIQLPGNGPAGEDDQSNWDPPIHVGHLNGVLGPWCQPG